MMIEERKMQLKRYICHRKPNKAVIAQRTEEKHANVVTAFLHNAVY